MTEADVDLAARAAAHWPGVTSAPEPFMARENLVFRVMTTAGPHALRLHRPGYHAQDEVLSELDFMAMLSARGVAVPRPAVARDGRLLVQVDGRLASLLSWLPGRPLGRVGQPLARRGAARLALFSAIGRQMGLMHALADAWTPPPGFRRPVWDAAGLVGPDPLWGRFWEVGSPDDRTALAALRGKVQAALAGQGDYGLIHADVGNENVLVQGRRVQIIDFDDMGWGFRLFDLATTLYKSAHEPDLPALQEALLRGYARQRPLPDLTPLPLLIALRAATYLSWIEARRDEPGMAEKARRYMAVAQRLIDALPG